ncbi:MAG TPA: SDR family NAD(P)-dependent oxidoreductase, partial [Vicinamibacteria bacterium]|nr:SDR family NAD(P)-dependent oxidoreductase [Vicinamibacteria bacterium]
MTETSRTVLVSGASAGIGRAICLRLLEEGHRVIGLARDFGKFAWNGEGFLPVEIDLADLEALPQRLKDLSRQHGGIDAVVCNAGRGQFGSLEEFSYQQIRSLVDLNFTSQAFLVRALLPGMKERGRG